MLACFAFIQDTNLRMYRGGFFVFAIIATIVVVDAAHAGSPVSRILSVRPLRWIGAISYGIYLWHWPINLYVNPVRYDLPFPVIFGLRCALTIGIAWLSFHLVERPVRRWLEAKSGRGDEPRRARSPWVTLACRSGRSPAGVVHVRPCDAHDHGVRRPGPPRARPVEPAVVTPSRIDLPGGYGVGQPLQLTIVGDSTGFALAEPRLLQGVTFTNGSILGCGATTGDYYYGDFLLGVATAVLVRRVPLDRHRPPPGAGHPRVPRRLGGVRPERGRTTALGRVRRMASLVRGRLAPPGPDPGGVVVGEGAGSRSSSCRARAPTR